jgi:hypothetical protein
MEGKRVIRWTLPIDAATLTFNDGAGHTSAKTLSAGNYLCRGEATSGGPSDLLTAFRTLWNAAFLSLYGSAGAIAFSLSSTGHLTLSGATQPIALQTSGTTFDTGVLGFGAGAITLGAGISVTAPNQVAGCWYPHADHVLDTGEHVVRAFTQSRSLLGFPDIVKHAGTSDTTRRRRIAWDDIHGARVLQWLADQADYAAIAELAAADPHAALEVMLERLVDDNQVYVYDTELPATHTQAGPYYVVLDDQVVSLGGVPFEAERQDLLQRRFSAALELVR